jgi:hypothetical protein
MAIQDFTAGQVLTAEQMDNLQANDYNQTVSTKTVDYTLVAADKGTRVVMNSASATTITVDTGLFSAGDTLFLQNIGVGTCTVTAGTATVSTSSSLALAQYQGGTLYFTSASAAIFLPSDGAASSWQAWTPILTNLTAGNGTTVARYYQDGKLVIGYFIFTFGSTSSITGQPSISVPVNISTSYPLTGLAPAGNSTLEDSGSTTFNGYVGVYRDLQRFFVYVFNASATYVSQSGPSSTVPFTWGTNDVIYFSFVYEAA